ncbi:MAG: hypothetical protein GEU99_11030 [Luteitalea sp.]|nr:hypothetical protein [Luteitalea sp.]
MNRFQGPHIVSTRVHHFDHDIGGRAYHIEVAQVGVNTWRAQVVTPYGGRSALMPFYDATPADAADRLAEWLARAHRHAASSESL